MEPSRPLKLAGACAKTTAGATFEAEVTLYKDKKVQGAKIQECKTIQSQTDGSLASETGINQLLVALYADFANCQGPPFAATVNCTAFKEGWDEQDVVDFAAAICSLDTTLNTTLATGDVECVVPSVANLATSPAGGNTIWGGWIAVGPVKEEAIVELPASTSTEGFAVKVEDLDDDAQVSGIFVAIRENPPTNAGTSGCPEIAGASDSNYDCEGANFTVDVDTPVALADADQNPIQGNGLYVAMCEAEGGFAEVPGRCECGQCDRGGVPGDDPLELLDCSISTRSFKASTWAGMDNDPAARDIHVVATTHANSGSEGVVAKLFGPATSQSGPFPTEPRDTCQTIPQDADTAECTFFDVPAADPTLDPGTALWYKVVAEKLTGTSSHSGERIDSLAQDDPPVNPGVKEFPVDVVPLGQQ